MFVNKRHKGQECWDRLIGSKIEPLKQVAAMVHMYVSLMCNSLVAKMLYNLKCLSIYLSVSTPASQICLGGNMIFLDCTKDRGLIFNDDSSKN